MESDTRGDILGRIVGMLVFLLGVVSLLFVFFWAYKLFNASPVQALGLNFTGDPKRDPPLQKIGVQFAWLLIKFLALFIMSIAGSLIANKGINLYFSALQGSPISVVRGKSAVSPPA